MLLKRECTCILHSRGEHTTHIWEQCLHGIASTGHYLQKQGPTKYLSPSQQPQVRTMCAANPHEAVTLVCPAHSQEVIRPSSVVLCYVKRAAHHHRVLLEDHRGGLDLSQTNPVFVSERNGQHFSEVEADNRLSTIYVMPDASGATGGLKGIGFTVFLLPGGGE